MTPLRQKLIDEIQLRGFSPNTLNSYVHWVATLAQFYHRSPDQLGDSEIKGYLLHLLRVRKLAVGTLIVAVSALRLHAGTKIMPSCGGGSVQTPGNLQFVTVRTRHNQRPLRKAKSLSVGR